MNLYRLHTNPESLLYYDNDAEIEIPKAEYNEYVAEILNWVQLDEFAGIMHITDEYFAEHKWMDEVTDWPEFTDWLRYIVKDFNFGKYTGYYIPVIAERLMQQRNTNVNLNGFDLSDLAILASNAADDDSDRITEWDYNKSAIMEWIEGGYIK